MLAGYPTNSLQLHISVLPDNDITVYDACPSRTDFKHFIASEELRDALAGVGLPWPRIEAVGEVHTTGMRSNFRHERCIRNRRTGRGRSGRPRP